MKHPIPTAALDDRFAIVGTSGSGKTYAAKGCIERLLAQKHRVVIVDPLDVWFGLRLGLDGATPGYDVRILGGKHADMPLNEAVGALIGEAIATTSESCIVALSAIKTSAGRQRFMQSFLDAIYERTDPEKNEPYHIIFDEADLWAPQKPMGKEAMLCHLMEEIVRRGRVKGFIPWLISQRPAVLNKNVLSQADNLIAMKLTSSHDRNAIKAWVQSTADEGQWTAIDKGLPTLERGTGVVWMPGRDVLEVAAFPENATFDSSRTPKRGEKKLNVKIAPLNIDALRAKLSTVEVEAKANDPKILNAEIVSLRAQLASKAKTSPPDLNALENARQSGFVAGFKEAQNQAVRQYGDLIKDASAFADRVGRDFTQAFGGRALFLDIGPRGVVAVTGQPVRPALPQQKVAGAAPAMRQPSQTTSGDASLTNPQRQLLQALAWWRHMGHDQPTRTQVAAIAGWKPKGSNLRNRLTELSSLGLVRYPQSGTVELTERGTEAAPSPDMSKTLIDSIRAILTNPQLQLFDALLEIGIETERAALASRVGWEPGGSNLRNRLTELSQLEVVEYPQRGTVMLQRWVVS